MPDKPEKETGKETGINKEALDALNFKNNILAKLRATKNKKKTNTKSTNKKTTASIRGLGRLGQHSKAYRKRNTRTA
ncbi:MAG: hypothetical protein GOVbin3205_54 [Prokaryotic dsDNA virus sp.]|nr:MAG: hypothetical protein GOVbin3205_54 [Prokaryotic dsDNA virus sp.]|tara:strand:- start:1242 stop:1472 length:231 start_codon:yes stop_codon:yes gene_type:complete